MKAILRFLGSVWLAVSLILLLTLLSIASTLLGWTGFFGSLFFLVPASAFVVNLSVCTVRRLVTRKRTRTKPRHGPDLVHIGLLLLIAGGLLTATLRREKFFYLAEGEEAAISPSLSVSLLSFEFLTYDNGTPKAWISTVRVVNNGKVEVPTYAISVNRPLRRSGIRVYQASWKSEGTLVLRDDKGGSYTLENGGGFTHGDSIWYFADVETAADAGWSAVFQQWKDDRMVSQKSVARGGAIGPYTVDSVEGRLLTGLKAVSDPGAIPVISALAVIGVGLALTFIQKRRDESR